jgi:hypothetical protein
MARGFTPEHAHLIPMKNPLDSLPATVACGLALTLALYLIARHAIGT